jgi:hypothetical protein
MSDHVEIDRQDVTTEPSCLRRDPQHRHSAENVPKRGLKPTFKPVNTHRRNLQSFFDVFEAKWFKQLDKRPPCEESFVRKVRPIDWAAIG